MAQKVDVLREGFPTWKIWASAGKPCPRRGKKRQQVLSLTETLADTLGMGMRAHRWAPPSAGLPNWPLYAWHMLQRSPTLQVELPLID
jgi:hypothetical protein